MGAVMNVDPSLINFLGGYGRAFGAIGKSMTDINQAKLDLDQQERDNTSKNAYLKLQERNTQLGVDNANYVKQKDFETRNDKLNTNANTNALILGESAPTEMSNRYAQLSLVDPAVTAAMAKKNSKEYKGSYDGTDGNKYALWSDGTSSAVIGGAKPFIDKAFTVDTQYIGGKPTKVGTSLLSGNQNSIELPGITDNEYNTRLSSGLALENTLTTQKNAKKLGLTYDPLIEDAKDTITAKNTLSTLSDGGFTKQIDPGMVQYYMENLPKGYQLNVRSGKVNGVDVYLVNPDKLWIKPAK